MMGNEVTLKGYVDASGHAKDVMTSTDDFSTLLRAVVARRANTPVEQLTTAQMNQFLGYIDNKYGVQEDYKTFSIADVSAWASAMEGHAACAKEFENERVDLADFEIRKLKNKKNDCSDNACRTKIDADVAVWEGRKASYQHSVDLAQSYDDAFEFFGDFDGDDTFANAGTVATQIATDPKTLVKIDGAYAKSELGYLDPKKALIPSAMESCQNLALELQVGCDADNLYAIDAPDVWRDYEKGEPHPYGPNSSDPLEGIFSNQPHRKCWID